jgi:hypothetical protein
VVCVYLAARSLIGEESILESKSKLVFLLLDVPARSVLLCFPFLLVFQVSFPQASWLVSHQRFINSEIRSEHGVPSKKT